MANSQIFRGVAAALPCCLATAAYADEVTFGERSVHRYELRASTFTPSAQAEAAIAVDAEGNLFAAWSSRRQQSGRYGVYGQRFTPDGAAVGAETCLNLWTDSHQRLPAVATDGKGRTWVVWQSHGQDGSAGAIVGRRFDTDGTGSSEVPINRQWGGHQSDPVVAAAPDGSAFVAWTTWTTGSGAGIRGRLVSASGVPVGNELCLGPAGMTAARSPAVAAGADGDFVAIYAVADEHDRPAAIRVRTIDGAGAVGEATDVTGAGAVGPMEPVIGAAPGGYVVAWIEAGGRAVRARRLDGRGCPVGEPFEVATETAGVYSGAAVAAAGDGRFAVAFNGRDDDGLGVFARMFARDGSCLGGCIRVNRHTPGRQAMRAAAGTGRAAFSPDGVLACVWDGNGGFGDGSGVNVTLLSPVPLEAAGQMVTDGGTAAPAAHAVALPHVPPRFDARAAEAGQREVVSGITDIGFTGMFSTGWTPPDPHLAVGPQHVVIMTNGAIAFFMKDGTVIFQDQIEGSEGFWGELGATGFVFDPEVLYDELSGRFFAMASEAFGPGNTSYVLIAVSDDSGADGSWHKYRYETTALSADVFDSPNISVDETAVYVTGDAPGSVYPIYIFDKASMLAGVDPVVTNSLTLPTTTQSAGIPPVSFDDPPALYMIEHREPAGSSSVRLVALQDGLGTPSITETMLGVPVYGPPEEPPQMGTTIRPLTFDARFWSVAYRNGSLWATHHIHGDRVLARWYEIAMNGWPDSGMFPELVQSGEIDPGPGVRTFFSAITVDAHGNAALVFARGSEAEFFSMATAFRYAGDPPGTFRPDVIHRSNSGPYIVSRWGDYGGMNVDPADGLTFWAHHEYAEANTWRTWVAGFTPPYDPADLDHDGAVGVADFLILLEKWGPCPDPPDPCPGDIDGDGSVGVRDFLQMLAAWG